MFITTRQIADILFGRNANSRCLLQHHSLILSILPLSRESLAAVHARVNLCTGWVKLNGGTYLWYFCTPGVFVDADLADVGAFNIRLAAVQVQGTVFTSTYCRRLDHHRRQLDHHRRRMDRHRHRPDRHRRRLDHHRHRLDHHRRPALRRKHALLLHV